MFNVQFNLDGDRLRKFAQANVQKVIDDIQAIEDKTFRFKVDDQVYDIRYEIDPQGQVQLFVRSPQTSDKALIVPDLTLNIGELLLPESMSLDGEEGGFNPETTYVPYKTLGSNSLNTHKLKRIYDEILRIGFINLVKN